MPVPFAHARKKPWGQMTDNETASLRDLCNAQKADAEARRITELQRRYDDAASVIADEAEAFFDLVRRTADRFDLDPDVLVDELIDRHG